MTMSQAETALEVLSQCSNTGECLALRDYVTGHLPRSDLGYEDLFYPARCHSGDGLVLQVDVPGPNGYIEYGPGDLFYQLSDDERTIETAVDPFSLWNRFKAHEVDITPVLREDTPFGADE